MPKEDHFGYFEYFEYFGYSTESMISPSHLCCDIHKAHCTCPSCTAGHYETLQHLENLNISPTTTNTDSSVSLPDPPIAMYEELLEYRQQIYSGRSCVGSVSFSTGFSIELIDAVMSSFHNINSLDFIMDYLPVFSKSNAEAIYSIVCKYKN